MDKKLTLNGALDILKDNGHKVIKHTGWDVYEVIDAEGERVTYGAELLDEEGLIDYVESYIL